MDTRNILAQLRAERGRIEKAIAAIETLSQVDVRTRRVVKAARWRPMSAATRKRLSQLLKQRWAQGKMKPKQKPAQPRRSNTTA